LGQSHGDRHQKKLVKRDAKECDVGDDRDDDGRRRMAEVGR
jgi:hypothetical protein